MPEHIIGPHRSTRTISYTTDSSTSRIVKPTFEVTREEVYDVPLSPRTHQISTLSIPEHSPDILALLPSFPPRTFSALDRDPNAQLLRRNMKYYETAEYRYTSKTSHTPMGSFNLRSTDDSSLSGSSVDSSTTRNKNRRFTSIPSSDRVLRSRFSVDSSARDQLYDVQKNTNFSPTIADQTLTRRQHYTSSLRESVIAENILSPTNSADYDVGFLSTPTQKFSSSKSNWILPNMFGLSASAHEELSNKPQKSAVEVNEQTSPSRYFLRSTARKDKVFVPPPISPDTFRSSISFRAFLLNGFDKARRFLTDLISKFLLFVLFCCWFLFAFLFRSFESFCTHVRCLLPSDISIRRRTSAESFLPHHDNTLIVNSERLPTADSRLLQRMTSSTQLSAHRVGTLTSNSKKLLGATKREFCGSHCFRNLLLLFLLLLPLCWLLFFIGRPLDNSGPSEHFFAGLFPSDNFCRRLHLKPLDDSISTKVSFRFRCLLSLFTHHPYVSALLSWCKASKSFPPASDTTLLSDDVEKKLEILHSRIRFLEDSFHAKLVEIQSRLETADRQSIAASNSFTRLKIDSESLFSQLEKPLINNSARIKDLTAFVHEALADIRHQLALTSLTHKADLDNSTQNWNATVRELTERAANISASLLESYSVQLSTKVESLHNSSSQAYLDKLAKFELIVGQLKLSMNSLRLDLESQISRAIADLDSFKLSMNSRLVDSEKQADKSLSEEMSSLRKEIIIFAEKQVTDGTAHLRKELDLANSKLGALENLHHQLNASSLNLARGLKELAEMKSTGLSELQSSISEQVTSLMDQMETTVKQRLYDYLHYDLLSEFDLNNKDSKFRQNVLHLMKKYLQEDLNAALKDRDSSMKEGATLTQIQLLIDGSLERFARDRTGLVDYALESAGGRVVGTRCTRTYTQGSTVISIFGLPLAYLSKSPNTILQPGNQPGDCWAFYGSEGQAIIRLVFPIHVTGVSLEHLPRSMALPGTFKSAPRGFFIKALDSENANDGELLGSFTYSDEGPPIQYFPISKKSDVKPVQFVEFGVTSNHGNLDYTCVYRIRVHGDVQTSNSIP